jgi:predicted class III extradiol MEMO1 family dioxygenase
MLTQLKATDDELIDAICRGDAEGFFSAIQCTGNASQVCGVSPIYLTLRLLAPTRGEKRGYSVCPADDKGTSFVTICGVTLHAS